MKTMPTADNRERGKAMPEDDPSFLDFLLARLAEENEAAQHRVRLGADGRGMDYVRDLIEGLQRGEPPDRMTCDLLVAAYARHPDFKDTWNRWLR